MKKLFYSVLTLLFCLALNTTYAQMATVSFSQEAFNTARDYGVVELQPNGQNQFAALPSVPPPCDGMPEDKKQAYQDEANNCCCMTGTCYFDGCKWIAYVFFPDPMNPACPQEQVEYVPYAHFQMN